MRSLKSKLSKALVKTEHVEEASKVKIEVKQEHQSEISHNSTIVKMEDIQSHKDITNTSTIKTKKPRIPSDKRPSAKEDERRKSANSAKNIVKNFARAMITFTLSDLASPYLVKMFTENNIDIKAYKQYFKLRKENMDGISSLRALLLAEYDDDEETVNIKKIFQYSCEIFLRDFSVNWVYSSKIGDKMAHVKARFKLLRRIRNPEYFTYLKF